MVWNLSGAAAPFLAHVPASGRGKRHRGAGERRGDAGAGLPRRRAEESAGAKPVPAAGDGPRPGRLTKSARRRGQLMNRRWAVAPIVLLVTLLVAGCGRQGLNGLELPGTAGRQA